MEPSARQGALDSLRALTYRFAERFAAVADPQQIQALIEEWRRVREIEARTRAAEALIDSNLERALRTLDARVRVFELLTITEDARRNAALPVLLEKLREEDDPAKLATLASSIVEVVTNAPLNQVAQAVQAIDAGQMDLEF